MEFQGLRQQVAHSLYLSPEVALYLLGIYALTGVCPMYRHHGHSLDAFEERHAVSYTHLDVYKRQIPYPLLVTGLHQTQLWGMAYLYLRWKGQLTPENLNKGDWKYYAKYIIPTAIATAGDIGLGNISFKYVPFTVYTIVKSSTIAFVLFFGCLFKVEVPSWRLFIIVTLMFCGVVMMGLKPINSDSSQTHGEIQETFGVILVVISCCLLYTSRCV